MGRRLRLIKAKTERERDSWLERVGK